MTRPPWTPPEGKRLACDGPRLRWAPTRVAGRDVVQLRAVAIVGGVPTTLVACRVEPAADPAPGRAPWRPAPGAAPLPVRPVVLPDYPGASWLVFAHDGPPLPDPHDDAAVPKALPDVRVLGRDDDELEGAPAMPPGTSRMAGAEGVWRRGWRAGRDGAPSSANPYQGPGSGRVSYRKTWVAGWSAGCRARED